MQARAFATGGGHLASFDRRRTPSTFPRALSNNVENLPLPDGSLGLPLVGETLSLVRNPDDFGVSRYKKFGDIWKTNILGSNTVMVYGEKNVLSVLRQEGVLVESKWPDVTKTLVGPRSLNLLKGKEHDRVKALMGSAFTNDALQRYIPTMERIVDSFLTEWAESLEKPFSSVERGSYLACALFGTCLLGLDSDAGTAHRVQALFDALSKGFQVLPVNLPFTAYGKAVQARKALLTEVEASLQRGMSCGSGLEIMINARDKNGKGLTKDEVDDAVLAMVFGNASMGPTCAKILQYAGAPDVLDKLRQEQDAVIEAEGTGLTMKALDSMKYCTAVVQETLRITPIVPVTVKQAKTAFELDGFKVPAGWQVFCHVGDSVTKYNADQFLPERWLSKKGDAGASECPFQREGGYSLPFAVGPRACLGQPFVMVALQVFIAILVRGFAWKIEDPDEEWDVFPAPRPKRGLMVSSFERVE